MRAWPVAGEPERGAQGEDTIRPEATGGNTRKEVYYVYLKRGHKQQPMKTASIREFRSNIHAFVNEHDAVVVTRHGKPVMYSFPVGDEAGRTMEEKRKAFMAGAEARRKAFAHIDEAEMLRDFEAWRKERRRRRGGR